MIYFENSEFSELTIYLCVSLFLTEIIDVVRRLARLTTQVGKNHILRCTLA